MPASAHEVGGVHHRLVVRENPSGMLALVDPVPALVDGHDCPCSLLLAGGPLGHVWSKLATHVLDRKPVKAIAAGSGGRLVLLLTGSLGIQRPACTMVSGGGVRQECQLLIRFGKVGGTDLV